MFSHTCTPHLNSAPLTSILATPTPISAIPTPPSIASDPISSYLPAKFGSNTTFPIEPSSNPTPPIESIHPPSSPIVPLQSSDQSTIPLAPINTHPMHTRSKNGIYKPKTFHTATLDYTQTEPPTYHTTSKFPQWCIAMTEEYTALQRQQTWSLVPPPIDKNIVGCKGVFKLKRNSDGVRTTTRGSNGPQNVTQLTMDQPSRFEG